MQLQATDTSRLDWSGDGLAIGLFEDVELTGDLAALDEKLAGSLKDLISDMDFKGKSGSSVSTRVGNQQSIRKLILVGLGKSDVLTLDGIRRSAAAAAGRAPSPRTPP